MAGTFTHWMICEKALDLYNGRKEKHRHFYPVLARNHFVNLGAVGPDYPYLTDLAANMLKVHTWADRMHYENTGEFVKIAMENLRRLKGEEFPVCLAWICGYVSHVLADSVVHPVVNAIVGPYLFNSEEHRHCEMVQDSFIFREIKGTELRYSEYAGLMKQCSDPGDVESLHPAVRKFWMEVLQSSHQGGGKWFDRIEPDQWHGHFLSRIAGVEDPAPVFRHIREEKYLSYKKLEEITKDERRRFIEEVTLPNGKTGRFREDVFDKAVDRVVEVWHRMFTDVESGDIAGVQAYIRNWNLDTGVDEDGIYFWP